MNRKENIKEIRTNDHRSQITEKRKKKKESERERRQRGKEMKEQIAEREIETDRKR